MPGTLKLNSGGAGNLILTPSGSVGSDVTVTVPAVTGTAAVADSGGRISASSSNNTGLGYQVLNSSSASNNTAFGYQAGYAVTSGGNSVAIGYQASYTCTTAVNNTVIGYRAFRLGTSDNNVAMGYDALGNATGGNNTAVGYQAGNNITSGTYNCFIGRDAGVFNTSGNYNTFIGSYNGFTGLDTRTSSYYIVLSDGSGAWRAYSNSANWYQNSNGSTWATTSDGRIKENVVEIAGLDVITKLRPVEFDYIEPKKRMVKTGDEYAEETYKQHDVGFIAQEYQTVLPEQVHKQTANEFEKELAGEDEIYGIQQNLVPYLVKAIQELKAEVDSLKAQLDGVK